MMKIKRILIANRGEIAVRIMKTAQRMKIETVAVKTAVEPNAMYLASADMIFDNTEDNSEIPVFLNIESLLRLLMKQMPMRFIPVMDSFLKTHILPRNALITI